MKSIRWFITSLLLLPALVAQSQNFQEFQTNQANIRLSATNAGTFGNAFRGYKDGTGTPSLEYPAGSGIEHLFEGGIWIGGISNGVIRVSTSAYDAPQGYAPGRGGFEFNPVTGPGVKEISSLKTSPKFNFDAISHQDFLASFTDSTLLVPGTSIPINNHTNPMDLVVDMRLMNWNYNFSDFMAMVNLTIRNEGSQTFDDLYIGLWNNTVVRNVNITPAGAGGATFYSQGGNGFVDSLNLAYCYDATGDVGFTDSYVGQVFLGAEDEIGFHHPKTDGAFDVNYNAWVFNNSGQSTFFFPTTDQQRYLKMSDGFNNSPCWNNPTGADCLNGLGVDLQTELNKSGNRSDLISAGPFDGFGPGDEITIAFAYVVAKKVEDGNPNGDNNNVQKSGLLAAANWAQTTYNGEDANFNGILDEGEDKDGDGAITRFILPTPPSIPYCRVEAGEGTATIYWSNNSVNSEDPISKKRDFEGYNLYATSTGFDVFGTPNIAEDLNLIASFDSTGNIFGLNNGFEQVTLPNPYFFDGDTTPYHFAYTLSPLPNGWQTAVAVTAFDKGDPNTGLESLESSTLANVVRVFPGAEGTSESAPYVYPNPYYMSAEWEGQSNFQEESRKIIFANLPAYCRITITTAAGDLIDTFEHTPDYDGSDIRWFRTFGSEDASQNTFSGGEHAWDLLSKESQIIARGTYLLHVQDLTTGKRTTEPFIIVK
jgi:hypothetical protein